MHDAARETSTAGKAPQTASPENSGTVGACLQAILPFGVHTASIACKAGSYSGFDKDPGNCRSLPRSRFSAVPSAASAAYQ